MSKYTILEEGDMGSSYDDSTPDFDTIKEAKKEISSIYKEIDGITLKVVEIKYNNDKNLEIYNLDGTLNKWASQTNFKLIE